MSKQSARFRVTVIGIAGTLMGSSVASAADLFPPAWRGQARTTFQQWDFSGGPGGGAPDVLPFHNPYGVPNFYTLGAATWEPVSTAPGVVPRGSTWQLSNGGSALADNMNAGIDISFTPSSAKLDTCQIVYFGDLPVVSVEEIPGYGSFTTVLDSVSIVPLADGWLHATFHHTLIGTASPSGERFVVSAPIGGATWIDHLVIDTIALPTPGAGMLALLGSGMVARRRRR